MESSQYLKLGDVVPQYNDIYDCLEVIVGVKAADIKEMMKPHSIVTFSRLSETEYYRLGFTKLQAKRLSILFNMPSILQHHLLNTPKPKRYQGSTQSEELFRYIRNMEREMFVVAFLTKNLELITVKEYSIGDDGNTLVPVAEIVKEALLLRAKAVITAHNHPGATASFSDDDEAVIIKLANALELLGIKLVDNFVETAEGYVNGTF